MRAFALKIYNQILGQVDLKAEPHQVVQFYCGWLELTEQLISEGHDKNGIFAKTAEKLRAVLQNPPNLISFYYPFTLGKKRQVMLDMDMFDFQIRLSKTCEKKEKEQMGYDL